MKSIVCLSVVWFLVIHKNKVCSQSKANLQDSMVLVELYNSLGGKNWIRSDGWLNGPVKNWFGITLDGNGYVWVIDLKRNNLNGVIPESIGNLSRLRYLHLQDSTYPNRITGNIPASIGKLEKLDYLILEGNTLNGSIPETIGDLENLTFLNLASNHLTGNIPASIVKLQKLRTLRLYKNQLSGQLPENFRNLSSLIELSINNNLLEGSLSRLSSLPSIMGMSLHQNRFTDTFSLELLSNPNLKSVSLFNNKLTFSSLENLPDRFPDHQSDLYWYPQDSLNINQKDSLLSVSAGGTLSNNTYTWVINEKSQNQNDSSIIARMPGIYRVVISNPKARGFLLSKKIEYHGTYKIIDPYPSLQIRNDGTFENNLSLLDTNNIVKGVAADGVSRLIIYTKSNIPLKFSILNSENGTLSTLSSNNKFTEIVIQPFNDQVALVYHAPSGVGNNLSSKDIVIKASFDGSKTHKEITFKLVTPPVLFIHGMWSKPKSAWVDTKFVEFLNKRGVNNIQLVDYENESHKTFDPGNVESMGPRMAIYNKIQNGLRGYRDMKIAATQVDIIGHSLGGLMARSFSQFKMLNIVKDNYNQGYIHKLITIGTPHKGSPLGPLLYSSADEIVYYYNDQPIYYSFKSLFDFFNKPIGTVHLDFNPDISKNKALQNIEATDVHGIKKVHAIVGIAGVGNDVDPMDKFCRLIFRSPIAQIMQNDHHDFIVSEKSQLGGLSYGKTATSFSNTTHSELFFIYETETKNPNIHQKVYELLMSNVKDDFADRFPAPINARENSNKNFNIKKNVNKRFINNNIGIKLTDQSRNINPSSNQSEVEISFTTINTKVENPLLLIKDFGWLSFPENGPYTVKVPLSNLKKVGRFSFCVIARDTSGALLTDTSSFYLQPKGTLYKLEVTPNAIHLDSNIKQEKLTSVAHFINGIDTIKYELNHSLGITYKNYTNKITVDSVGLVQALNPGEDSILITYMNQSILVKISVDNNYDPDKKLSNSILFSQGDVVIDDSLIILNGYSTSGEPVQFTLIQGEANLNYDLLKFNSPGKISIKATSKGNAYFRNPNSTQQTFCINPSKPNIILDNSNSLQSSSTTGNQWYLNNVLLNGATGQTYKPTMNGIYSVKVTTNGCTSASSENFSYVSTSINSPELERAIILAPNPVEDRLHITYKNNREKMQVMLFDITGRNILAEGNFTNTYQMNLAGVAAGSYFIKILNKRTGDQLIKQIIKK